MGGGWIAELRRQSETRRSFPITDETRDEVQDELQRLRSVADAVLDTALTSDEQKLAEAQALARVWRSVHG